MELFSIGDVVVRYSFKLQLNPEILFLRISLYYEQTSGQVVLTMLCEV